MIRPRPTQHVNGVTSHSFHTFTTNPSYAASRPVAYCPNCGARLSYYRTANEKGLCAPCQLTEDLEAKPEELHPEPGDDRYRPVTGRVCHCGNPKDNRSRQCRTCRIAAGG